MAKTVLAFVVLLGVAVGALPVHAQYEWAGRGGPYGDEGYDDRVGPRGGFGGYEHRGGGDEFGGPQVGQEAPGFTLRTLEGERVRLADYLGKQPIVIETGSYTCPVFRQKHRGMESLYRRYGDDAAFFMLYTVEAHPQGDPSPYTGEEWVTVPNDRSRILFRQPTTMAEREELAQQAKDAVGVSMPMVIDGMSNATWRVFGSAPNAAYLIGTDGRVKLRQDWFEAREFEQALRQELTVSRGGARRGY